MYNLYSKMEVLVHQTLTTLAIEKGTLRVIIAHDVDQYSNVHVQRSTLMPNQCP